MADGSNDETDISARSAGSATTVFARKVAPKHSRRYEAWLGAVSKAAAGFPGYGGTTIVRPATEQDEYVAIVQFDNTEHLDAWLQSDRRQVCLGDLKDIGIEREEITTLAGLDRWVSHLGTLRAPPPNWKMAIVLLTGLYPIALLQGWLVEPLLSGLPWPLALLVSLCGSVALMVWVVVPALSKLLSRWLGAGGARSRVAVGDSADAESKHGDS